MRKTITRIAVGLLCGGAAGALARGPGEVRVPIAAPRPAVSAANDGYQPLITVEVEPAAVVRGGAGEALDFHVSLVSRSERAAAVRWAYEIVDDEGNPLARPATRPVVTVAARGTHEARLTTPAGLGDGWFQVRVTAAGADGREDTVQIAERFFAVRRGAVAPVSADEWFQKSNANRGRRL